MKSFFGSPGPHAYLLTISRVFPFLSSLLFFGASGYVSGVAAYGESYGFAFFRVKRNTNGLFLPGRNSTIGVREFALAGRAEIAA